MVGWHHQLVGHEFEQTLGDGEGQGSLECCRQLGHRVRHDLVAEQQQAELWNLENGTSIMRLVPSCVPQTTQPAAQKLQGAEWLPWTRGLGDARAPETYQWGAQPSAPVWPNQAPLISERNCTSRGCAIGVCFLALIPAESPTLVRNAPGQRILSQMTDWVQPFPGEHRPPTDLKAPGWLWDWDV